jgi:hypothetical protein
MRRRRKKYWPTFLLAAILWGWLGLLLIFTEPELIKDILLPGIYLPFFLVFFPAVFFTAAVIWGSSRRGLLTAAGLTVYLLLRIFGLGHGLNLLLILGILIVVDRYFN